MSDNNKFDFDALTLGEVATVEDLSGMGIASLSVEKPQGKFLAALVMVARRRNGEPGFTFNQALAVPLLEAQAYLGLGDDDEDDGAGIYDNENDADPTADAEGNGDGSEPTVSE